MDKQKKIITYGIQGGKGSFNELALLQYFSTIKSDTKTRTQMQTNEIKYLFTTSAVLDALKKGDIDYGQFAICNSTGGVVDETINALATGKYKFQIIAKYNLKIAHHLMKRKDVKMSEISQIMTHPQVFAQCKAALQEKYPELKQIVGKGDLIDNAKAAEAVATTDLGKNTAYLGNRGLSEIFGLKIVDENLQDTDENFTSFLLVKR